MALSEGLIDFLVACAALAGVLGPISGILWSKHYREAKKAEIDALKEQLQAAKIAKKDMEDLKDELIKTHEKSADYWESMASLDAKEWVQVLQKEHAARIKALEQKLEAKEQELADAEDKAQKAGEVGAEQKQVIERLRREIADTKAEKQSSVQATEAYNVIEKDLEMYTIHFPRIMGLPNKPVRPTQEEINELVDRFGFSEEMARESISMIKSIKKLPTVEEFMAAQKDQFSEKDHEEDN